MPLATCPSPDDLEGLFLGGLREEQVRALEEHVLGCAGCLATLKKQVQSRDTLAGVLRDDTRIEAVASGPAVDNLMKKLKSMRAASSAPAGSAMITFVCSGCQKRMSAKPELAGKKVKCRSCGQMTIIPGHPVGQAAPEQQQVRQAKPDLQATADAQMRTVPPRTSSADSKTLAPSSLARDISQTQEPSSASRATEGDSKGSGHDPSLTDF